MATGKTAAEDTDPTHIIRFLGMMTNSGIARKITQKGIPEGMTLGKTFTWAIELEAGYQLSEGVSLARPPEIMQVQEIEEVDEIGAMQRRLRDCKMLFTSFLSTGLCPILLVGFSAVCWFSCSFVSEACTGLGNGCESFARQDLC